MRRPWQGLGRAAILAWLTAPAVAATDLPAAIDLRAEAAAAARAGGPLIVVFSRADCKHCATVKRDYLLALTRDPRYREWLSIRQINQDREQALIDFKGAASSHARFAAAEKIKLVPVVAFYGPDGRQLSEAIVGARLPDFYPGYLADAIEQARKALLTP